MQSIINKIVNETIFHLDNNEKLTEINETNYISEDLSQQLLADYPNLSSLWSKLKVANLEI